MLVAAASTTMAVAIVAMAISAAVAIPAATCFLAGKIPTLLRRGPPFNLAHLLRTGLALGALEGALLVVAVRGLPIHPLHRGAVLTPLPIGLGGALGAK